MDKVRDITADERSADTAAAYDAGTLRSEGKSSRCSSASHEKRRAAQILLGLYSQRSTWRRHGRLHVFCKETLMFAPVKLWWWMTEVFVILTTVLFTTEFYPIDKVVLAPAIIIAILEWMAFYKTCMKDPGVVPRPPFVNAFRTLLSVFTSWDPRTRVTKTVVHPSGVREQLSYCWRCHHYRSLTTSHCGTCDCCMLQHDHHCPVFGGCVAQNNLSSFHTMVVSMSGYWLYTLGYCIYNMATTVESVDGNNSAQTILAARLSFSVIMGETVIILVIPPLVSLLMNMWYRRKRVKEETPTELLRIDVLKFAHENNFTIQEIIQLEEILVHDSRENLNRGRQDLNHNTFP